MVTYVNGLKEGEVREWYNNGVLRIKVHYEHGREQDVGENPALIAYDETGAIFSTRYFNEGKPHGLHVMYHPNGREAERVSYDDAGKMDGLLETFSDDGTLIGESVFEHGRPIGKAWRNYPSGAAKLRADYTQEIALVEEFAENGQCVARYHVQDERYVGPFQQWTPEGVLMVDFLYEEGSVTGREYYPDGSIKAIKEKSTLELYYPNGQLKEKVLFTEGKFDGAALGFFENGEPAFERMYAAGQFIGEQREYYPGKRLARSVTYDKLGKVHGVEKSYYPSGKLRAEVVYDHGILHGKKGHYREDGVVLEEGFYKKGKLEGIYQCRDPAGMLTRISYVNNKKEGAFTIFYPDGKTKALEATYHKGCLEGELKEYTQEGELISVIPYKHGKKEGMAKGFIQGVIATSALFTQDLREGEMIQYYPNGQVKKITPFKNDKREGEEIAYHKNGTIVQRNVYKEDRLDGVSQAWNEKGTLIFEADYVAGKREGRFNKYNDDGVLRLRQTFKGDELVSKEAVVMR